MLEVRIFKNRGQLSATDVDLEEVWGFSQYWARADGPLERREDLDIRYPGYSVWAMPWGAIRLGGIVPCKSLVVCRLTRPDEVRTTNGYCLQYETVRVAEPAPVIKPGLVLVDFHKQPVEKADISSLKRNIWRQLGDSGAPLVYLLQLKLDEEFFADICRDDVTGEAYPYVATKIVCLIKNP